eukprot:jgi/Mesvir1/2357/Mv26234-RA.1
MHGSNEQTMVHQAGSNSSRQLGAIKTCAGKHTREVLLPRLCQDTAPRLQGERENQRRLCELPRSQQRGWRRARAWAQPPPTAALLTDPCASALSPLSSEPGTSVPGADNRIPGSRTTGSGFASCPGPNSGAGVAPAPGLSPPQRPPYRLSRAQAHCPRSAASLAHPCPALTIASLAAAPAAAALRAAPVPTAGLASRPRRGSAPPNGRLTDCPVRKGRSTGHRRGLRSCQEYADGALGILGRRSCRNSIMG